jgi:hypothetical protein
VGDLETLPVLIRVEVRAHEQRVGRAERQREHQHLPVRRCRRPRPDPSRLLRSRGRTRTGVARRRAGSARTPPVAHHHPHLGLFGWRSILCTLRRDAHGAHIQSWPSIAHSTDHLLTSVIYQTGLPSSHLPFVALFFSKKKKKLASHLSNSLKRTSRKSALCKKKHHKITISNGKSAVSAKNHYKITSILSLQSLQESSLLGAVFVRSDAWNPIHIDLKHQSGCMVVCARCGCWRDTTTSFGGRRQRVEEGGAAAGGGSRRRRLKRCALQPVGEGDIGNFAITLCASSIYHRTYKLYH